MNRLVVVDTCTVINFAAVDHLPLLLSTFPGHLRYTEAVHRELRDLVAEYDGLLSILGRAQLGEPVEFSDPVDIADIDRLRRTQLGGRRGLPRQHLGEAQSIHLLRTTPSYAGATLLSDDSAAVDHARRTGLRAIESADVLKRAYLRRSIGCPDAYELLVAMRDAGRGVRVPASHQDVCPMPKTRMSRSVSRTG
ncbi:MAG TPA: hypothetical protein VF109_01040 [Mycobacteriales bacterium]